MRSSARSIDGEHLDHRIAALAARQDAVVTLEQLRELGAGRGAINSRRSRGLLVLMHVGIYRWGPLETGWTRMRAASLACAPDAILSDHAALAVHALGPLPAGPVDITTIGRHVRGRGIRPHSVRALHPDDVRVVRGLLVSSPARALVEVAGKLSARDLAGLVERAQVMQLITRGELASAVDRAGRRAGVAALREIAAEPQFTRSKAERRLLALLRQAELPEPAFNADVAGWECDAVWRARRVVLEFDSHAFHATRAAFERDRRKTAALTRSDHLVLRTTWTELTRRSHALVARIAEALAVGATRS